MVPAFSVRLVLCTAGISLCAAGMSFGQSRQPASQAGDIKIQLIPPPSTTEAPYPRPAILLPAPRLEAGPASKPGLHLELVLEGKPMILVGTTITLGRLGWCSANHPGQQHPTAAELRQQSAIIYDRMSPLQAPRFGKREQVPSVNRTLLASEAFAQGIRALKCFESSKAVALFDHALTLEPNNPVLLQFRAVGLYDLSRDKEAAEAARQGSEAASLIPGGNAELNRALEPIQGHRREFLQLASLYDIGAVRPQGTQSSPGNPLPAPKPLNTDKPKAEPRTKLPESAPPIQVKPAPRTKLPEPVQPTPAPKPPLNTDKPKT